VPNVPARTSSTFDVGSTSTMPLSAVRSQTMPPWTGTLPPSTPLRPAAAVTGMRAALATARTAATSALVAGWHTTSARAATSPPVAQHMARGHQSRLDSARVAGSVVTVVQALRKRSTTSSGTSTRAAPRCPRAAAAPPSMAMGGVGAPGAGPDTGVEPSGQGNSTGVRLPTGIRFAS
jgi:hypothetical protein